MGRITRAELLEERSEMLDELAGIRDKINDLLGTGRPGGRDGEARGRRGGGTELRPGHRGLKKTKRVARVPI